MGALITRAIFIALGSIILANFSWVMLIMGLFLLYTGVKIAFVNEEDSNQLYIETYIHRKYDYVQWVEHAENNGYDNKFVNVTPKLGRKTISPKNCEKTVFFTDHFCHPFNASELFSREIFR